MIKFLTFTISLIMINKLLSQNTLNLSSYEDLSCNYGLIEPMKTAIKNYNCISVASDYISNLCPYEQAVLINSISKDTTRCFSSQAYKPFLEKIIFFQNKKTLSDLSNLSKNAKSQFKCLNNVAEKLLTDSELKNILTPNKSLMNSQGELDSCMAKFIQFNINSTLYLRENLFRPIKDWSKVSVFNKNGKIRYFKYSLTHFQMYIDYFREFTKCVVSGYQVKADAISEYGKIFSESEKCKTKEVKETTENMFTYKLKDFLYERIGQNFINKVKSTSISSNDHIIKFIDIFNKIAQKDSKVQCTGNAKNFISFNLNYNNTLSEVINDSLARTNSKLSSIGISNDEFNKELDNQLLNLKDILSKHNFNSKEVLQDLKETYQDDFSSLLLNSFDENKLQNLTYWKYAQTSNSSRNLKENDISDYQVEYQLNLFKLLLAFPMNNLTSADQTLVDSISNELKTINFKNFPMCLVKGSDYKIDQCGFSKELTNSLDLNLPSRFFDNLILWKDLIATLSSSVDSERFYPTGIPDSLNEIYDLLLQNQPDTYFLVDNNKCYAPASEVDIDCSDILLKPNNYKDFFTGMIIIENVKVYILYYKDVNDFEGYDVIYGDVDICEYEDRVAENPTYFNIDTECQKQIADECPITPFTSNSETTFDNITDPEIKACMLSKDYSLKKERYDSECFSFVQSKLHTNSGITLVPNILYDIGGFIQDNLDITVGLSLTRKYDITLKDANILETIDYNEIPKDQESVLNTLENITTADKIVINDSTPVKVQKFESIAKDNNLFGTKTMTFLSDINLDEVTSTIAMKSSSSFIKAIIWIVICFWLAL